MITALRGWSRYVSSATRGHYAAIEVYYRESIFGCSANLGCIPHGAIPHGQSWMHDRPVEPHI